MKYLKNFKSLLENDDKLDDLTRDIFDVWETYKFRGPGIKFISDELLNEIDWEMGDYLDSPDPHVKVYSAEGFSEDGLEFQAEYMVIDSHIKELDLDNLEIANDEALNKILYREIELNGHSIRQLPGNTIQTSAEWEDFLKMFKKALTHEASKEHTISIEGKEYELSLILQWAIVKAGEDKKEAWWLPKKRILYIKSKQGEEIWAVYDQDR
jgi:hypothetical protein